MDIFLGEVSIDEIIGENKRLKNELLFTNKCLNVLIRFKSFVDSLINGLKDKIDGNDTQKYEILSTDVNEMKESLFRQKFFFDQMPDNEKIVKTFVCLRNQCQQRFDSGEDFVRHIEEKCNNANTSAGNSSESEVSEGIGSTEDSADRNDNLVEEGTQTDDLYPNGDELQFIELPVEYLPIQSAATHPTEKQKVVAPPPIGGPRKRGRPRTTLHCSWPGCDFTISDSRKKARLEAHINDHKGLSPYVCDHVGCGQAFKSRDFLRRHKKSHVDLLQEAMSKVLEPNIKVEAEDDGYENQSEPPIDVLSYVKPYMKYNGEELPIASTTEDMTITCSWPGCDFKVTDIRYKARLDAHMNEHNGIKPFVCEHVGCGLSFTSKENLQKHFRRLHESKAFICDYEGCGQRFQRRYRLIEHMSRHTGEYRYECVECHKKFVKRDTMNQHMDRMHKVLDQPLVCQIDNCGKEFVTYMAFKVHQMKVHMKEKRFACDEPNCLFKTVSSDKLGRHKLNVHQKEKPFSCEFEECAKTFVDHQALDNHIKRIHSTEMSFKCSHEGCDKAYRLQCDLNAHVRLKHLASKVACAWPGCEFQAPNTPILKYHEADVHMGIRNFKCEWPECGKAFKRKWHLKEHMRMHKNERPYACPWPGCGYRAVTSGTLSGHLKVHNRHIELITGDQ